MYDELRNKRNTGWIMGQEISEIAAGSSFTGGRRNGIILWVPLFWIDVRSMKGKRSCIAAEGS
jgi:hypothetical protein